MPESRELKILLSARDELSKALFTIDKEMKEIEKATKSAGGAAGDAGSSFGDMFKGMLTASMVKDAIYAVRDAVKAFISESIAAAAANERMDTTFGILIGDGEKTKELLMELDSLKMTAPFPSDSIENSANALLAMGVASDEVASTISMLGDVAAGTNAELDSVTSAFARISEAGELTGAALKTLTLNNIPLLSLLADYFGTTREAVEKMADSGKITSDVVTQAFRAMTSEGGKFEGAMEKQAANLDGSFITFHNTVELLSEKVGGTLSPAMKVLSEEFSTTASKVSDLLVTTDGEMTPAAKELADAFTNVASIFGSLATPAIMFMASKFLILASAINDVVGAAKSAEYWIGRLSGISQLKDALSGPNQLRGSFSDLGDTIHETFSTLNGSTTDGKTGMDGLSASTENWGGSMSSASSSASDASKEIEKIKKAVENLTGAYESFQSDATDAIENVADKTRDAVKELDDAITGIYTSMEEATRDYLTSQSEGNADIATSYVDQEEKVKDLQNTLGDLRTEYKKLLDEAQKQLFSEGITNISLRTVNVGEGETVSDSKIQELQQWATMTGSSELQNYIDKIKDLNETISETQLDLTPEQAALEDFAIRAMELDQEIADARDFNNMTDFEQSVSLIDDKMSDEEIAYQEKMTMLADELLATETQKAQMISLETNTYAAILALRNQAAIIYQGIMNNMANTTEIEVNRMIESLKKLQEAAGMTGGETYTEAASAITGSSTTTSNNVTINVSDLPAGASASEIAEILQEKLLRSVQLETLSSQ